jgi:hypothetical protein
MTRLVFNCFNSETPEAHETAPASGFSTGARARIIKDKEEVFLVSPRKSPDAPTTRR